MTRTALKTYFEEKKAEARPLTKSDVSQLLMRNTHIGPKVGWVLVGDKQEKFREIDLLN